MSSNEHEPDDAATPAPDPVELDALLAEPALWVDPSTGTEDAVITAILQEAEPEPHRSAEVVAPAPTPLRVARRPVAAWVAAAAAALLAVVVLLSPSPDGDSDPPPPDAVATLVGTELASDARAAVEVVALANGVRIMLEVQDLPPAPPGTYYQAWVRRSSEEGVSAGTFHMRGGDGPVVLWAGVSTEDYPLLTVTLQQESEGPESSGQVVLRGELS